MEYLPVEIFEEIIDCCDFNSLVALSLVSKDFYKSTSYKLEKEIYTMTGASEFLKVSIDVCEYLRFPEAFARNVQVKEISNTTGVFSEGVRCICHASEHFDVFEVEEHLIVMCLSTIMVFKDSVPYLSLRLSQDQTIAEYLAICLAVIYYGVSDNNFPTYYENDIELPQVTSKCCTITTRCAWDELIYFVMDNFAIEKRGTDTGRKRGGYYKFVFDYDEMEDCYKGLTSTSSGEDYMPHRSYFYDGYDSDDDGYGMVMSRWR